MEDEVHFQQHGSRCRMWVPPEQKEPVLFHAPTRKSVGYFGAVRTGDGKFVFQKEAGRFDGKSFFRFMKKLSRQSKSAGRRAIVVLDNARYHHALLHKSWREEKSGTFSLLFLPPYSPELNTSERIWKLTRRSFLHNRYFPALHDVTRAAEKCFRAWSRPNKMLRKLCSIT